MDLKVLEVYKAAEDLSDMVWNIVLKWDSFSRMTVGKQLVEAADGISANIAEGFGRYHFKEDKNLCYARGSLEETNAWLRESVRRNLLDWSDNPELTEMIDRPASLDLDQRWGQEKLSENDVLPFREDFRPLVGDLQSPPKRLNADIKTIGPRCPASTQSDVDKGRQ